MTETRLIITHGNHGVSADPEIVFSALLGSCVAVCLWDPEAKLGGMNHILLASQRPVILKGTDEGVSEMAALVDAVVTQGGCRDRLVAKVFGGARMVDGFSTIGSTNAEFAMDFLATAGIEVLGQSLGGTAARHLMFWPTNGTVRLKKATRLAPRMSVGAAHVRSGLADPP